MKKLLTVSAVMLTGIITGSVAQAQIISVQLNSGSLSVAGSSVSAGAPGFAEPGNTWNVDPTSTSYVGSGTSGPILLLKDSTGTPTLVSEATTNDGYYEPTGNAGFASGTGDRLLFSSGFLAGYDPGVNFSLNLGGLNPTSTYDLLLYTTQTFDFGAAAKITASAGSQTYYYNATTSAQASYAQGTSTTSSTPTSAANFVEFTNLSPTILGTLSASLVGSNAFNVTGFQIEAVAAPEPSSWAMMAAGLALLGFCIRRKARN